VGRRNLFGPGLPGAEEISEIFMVSLVYFGLAYAQHKKAHVSISVVTDRIPTKVANLMRGFGLTVVCIVLAWMIIETGQTAMISFETGEYRFGLLRVPVWPAKMVIPFGVAALLIETCFDIIDTLRSYLKRNNK
jgi:TRAP-type C4-dicarboxylate transport system permease small subunit